MKIKILLTLFLAFVSLGIYIYPKLNAPKAPPKGLSGNYDPKLLSANFHGQKINVPYQILNENVLGKKKSSGPKRIEIDLSNQKLYAFEGDKKVYEFLVSTGKWYPTPTGDFKVYVKYKYALMTGGSQAIGTYYYLPNVPFTMYFYQGFGIHGTYWHNNFGHPMSHGCVNMKTEEAEKLFYWANPSLPEGQNSVYGDGTPVKIYGVAPRS